MNNSAITSKEAAKYTLLLNMCCFILRLSSTVYDSKASEPTSKP